MVTVVPDVGDGTSQVGHAGNLDALAVVEGLEFSKDINITLHQVSQLGEQTSTSQ